MSNMSYSTALETVVKQQKDFLSCNLVGLKETSGIKLIKLEIGYRDRQTGRDGKAAHQNFRPNGKCNLSSFLPILFHDYSCYDCL